MRIFQSIVEDYKRTSKNVDSTENQKPPADNEVRISHSKIPTYVDASLKLLQVIILYKNTAHAF